MVSEEEKVLEEHFRSVDSAPAGLSFQRPVYELTAFIVSFIALALLALVSVVIAFNSGFFNTNRDLVFFSVSSQIVVVPLRLFVIVFFFTFAMYTHTSWKRRWFLAFSLISKFVIFCFAIDFITYNVNQVINVSLLGQQLISFLAAMVIFPETLLRQGSMPKPFNSPVQKRVKTYTFIVILITLGGSVAIAFTLEALFLGEITDLRKWALLGGIGPGIFLAQQAFALIFGLIGWLKVRWLGRKHFAPPVAILIPAYNESHGIADVIKAVDESAESYPGVIKLYIVDNNSKDDTTAVSQQAIDECIHITGEVLFCGTPGKAIALNYGADHIDEDFIVRIDADTVIGPGCLKRAMRHFANPKVGAVGGMPLPLKQETWIDQVRLVEVLLRHGFFQVALQGYNGMLGVPGMFAAYRKTALDEIGGTTTGMNGEDTDVCVRMGAAGWEIVSDPRAVYYSETPESFAHLYEQRTRWFRSIYHITSRARPILLTGHSVQGTVVLPFMLVSACRRAMLLPLLVFAILVRLLFHGAWPYMDWQPIFAVVIGLPMLMAVFVCCLYRRFDAIIYIPAYLLFRLLRSYFTLSSALSLAFPREVKVNFKKPLLPKRVKK